jgi:hypothetical protein
MELNVTVKNGSCVKKDLRGGRFGQFRYAVPILS